MTDANPDFRLAQQELTALRLELAKAEQKTTIKAGSAGAEYISRYRDFKYHETLFELMAKQYEMARLDEAREGAVIQVIDAAIPPERRSKPRRTLITAIAALAGIFFLTLFFYLRSSLQTAARQTEAGIKIRKLRTLLRPDKN
jgi:uncharacterized protein involved in exopolysaccharide biosynthesis